jgi:N-acetylglucosaminyldiphosphoundecaprenol N-acetyl-beta-D-mannosaminyltransferase
MCNEVQLGFNLPTPLTFRIDSASAIIRDAERAACDPPHLAYVVTANLDHLAILSKDAQFVAAYESAIARALDGMPLVWAARYKTGSNAVRITGHDLLQAIFIDRRAHSARVFVLCATRDCGERLLQKVSSIGIQPDRLAYYSPPYGFESDMDQRRSILEAIRRHATTHLILGVGAPKSEVWCMNNVAELPGIVAVCVGDAVNVFAGIKRRAPAPMQQIGLEWLFRLAQEPKRLSHRYLVRSWLGVSMIALGPTFGSRNRSP